jgi:hypothetical protein
MRPRVLILACAILLLMAATAQATSFVVPDDEELMVKSHAIIVGTVEGSFVRETDGTIETVYEVRIERSMKGFVAPRGARSRRQPRRRPW